MPGGPLDTQVSALLRKAGLPVMRYTGTGWGGDGIRVSNYSRIAQTCAVHVHVYEDKETERELSDRAKAILELAGGFLVDRLPGSSMLTVSRRTNVAAQEDPNAVAEASGLDVTWPVPNEWHVHVAGKRSVYSIRRTGKDDRTRYAVHGREYGPPLAKNLRTMQAAIDVVKTEIDKGKGE